MVDKDRERMDGVGCKKRTYMKLWTRAENGNRE